MAYTKAQSMGRELLNKLYSPHRQDTGGWLVQIVGRKGSGKTGATLSFLNHAFKQYPDERCWFSECLSAPIQIFKLGHQNDNIQFFAEKGKIVFRDRNKNMKPTERLKVIEFEDIEDLYEKSSPGKINVPFFEYRNEWADLIAYLTHEVGDWQHIFVDEMIDLAPEGSGAQWRENAWLAKVLKDARKSHVDVYWNTQMASSIDWRVRELAMMKIYLPGSMSGWKDRLYKQALWNLKTDPKKGNEAWIEEKGGNYGKIRMSDIWKPNPQFHIDAHPKRLTGDYYCPKCDKKHKVNSAIGQEHLKYA